MHFTDQWRLLCMMKCSSPDMPAECELHLIFLLKVQCNKTQRKKFALLYKHACTDFLSVIKTTLILWIKTSGIRSFLDVTMMHIVGAKSAP